MVISQRGLNPNPNNTGTASWVLLRTAPTWGFPKIRRPSQVLKKWNCGVLTFVVCWGALLLKLPQIMPRNSYRVAVSLNH